MKQNQYFAASILNMKLFNSCRMVKLLKKGALSLLFMLPLLFSGGKAEATHIMGADITYRCIDTLKFEVTVKIYRDCRGASVWPINLQVRCSNGGTQTVSLSRTSIREITPVCATEPSKCSPANTFGTGNGIEEHTFVATVDFNVAPLSALANCSGRIIFSTGQCCRNSSITTGGANAQFVTTAEIDISKAPCNTSPGLTSEPIAILCCDQPFFFNNGALDTANYDSLSYAWAQPLSAIGSAVGYSGGWSYTNPFSVYFPSPALTHPFNNPNANPPIGTYLDPITGDIILTPTNCSEETIAVIEITEWRANDSTGVMEDIGKTRRDLQFLVKSCPGNKPPVVNGPYSHSVCEGQQLCFNITTDDQPFIPPPPAPIPPADTVTLNWNGGIPGATFTILNPTARLKTGRFCWTPPVGAASSLPYTFTATARDDACPLNAVTVRGYRVLVKPKAFAEIDLDTMACGVYPITAVLADGFSGVATYNWTLLDSNRNLILSDKSGAFKASGSFLSNTKSDTLIFQRGGMYIIQLNLNNSSNCPSVFYDTLIVPPLLEADLSIGKDTFVCAGTDIEFDPIISNFNPPLSYQWTTMGIDDDGTFLNNVTTNLADTSSTFTLSIPNVQYDTAVGILIQDGSGCTAEDKVRVFLKANPLATLPADVRLCTYDELTIVPNLDTAYWIDPNGQLLKQGDTLFKEWYFNGLPTPFSIEDSVTVREEGMYVIAIVDSLGCSDKDTMFIFVNDTVVADAGPDQTVCLNDTFTLVAGGIDTAGGIASGLYQWYDITPTNNTPLSVGTSASISFQAQGDRLYRLELSRTQGGIECFDADTVAINVNQLPVISLGQDEEVCCDAGAYNLILKVNSARGGLWSSKLHPTTVSNNEFSPGTACDMIASPASSIRIMANYRYQDPSTTCINEDSLSFLVRALPTIITQEKQYCQDFGAFRLASNTEGVIVSPSNVSLGTPTWRCLDSNATVNRFQDNMLENRGGPGFIDYWLNISESAYEIQNPNSDTVVLEFTYRNQFGCLNKDTANIIISKVPKIEFRAGRNLCYDEGGILLNELFDVTPSLRDGIWTVQNVPGFRNSGALGGLTGDSINTLASTALANENATPNSWRLRYTHTSTGCPATLDTNLRINPLPTINLTPLVNRICETEANIQLSATPGGGTWTSSDPSALLTGNMFSPSGASVSGTDILFYYDFTNNTTGCRQRDSIFSSVDLQPTLNLPTNAVYCRPEGQTTLSLTLDISATNARNIAWIPTNIYGNRDRISTTPIDQTSGQGQVTLDLITQRADTFRIGANAQALGSCRDKGDAFEIIVNPLPMGAITNSNPEGCNPVTTDFGIIFTNEVDANTATYSWSLGDGRNATGAGLNAMYTTDGQFPVSVTITTDKGCDSTFTSNVQVNPIPNASFVPNPNNYTTAALPRFIFNNTSNVAEINGATIVRNAWDFGDINSITDTSIEESPSFYYNTDTATYCVNLEVTTNHGCISDTTVCVVVGPDLIVFIPNAFTPNVSGPTQNEGFKAIISGEKSMELTIFNRWGEILFQTSEKDAEWDGTYKGEPAQQDVYAYQLKVTALNDEPYTYNGTITLIR